MRISARRDSLERPEGDVCIKGANLAVGDGKGVDGKRGDLRKIDYQAGKPYQYLLKRRRTSTGFLPPYPESTVDAFDSSMSLLARVWFNGGSPIAQSLKMSRAMPPRPKRMTDPNALSLVMVT